MDVSLDTAAGVPQIEKMALAHVAMRGDTPGRAQRFAFFESGAHLRDIAADLERFAKRLNASRAQRFQFFAPQCNQLVLRLHSRRLRNALFSHSAIRNPQSEILFIGLPRKDRQ